VIEMSQFHNTILNINSEQWYWDRFPLHVVALTL